MNEAKVQERVADVKTQLKQAPVKKGQILRSGSLGNKPGTDKKSNLKKTKSEDFTRVTKHSVVGYPELKDTKRVSIADEDEVFIIPNKEDQKLQNGQPGDDEMVNQTYGKMNKQNQDTGNINKHMGYNAKALANRSKLDDKKQADNVQIKIQKVTKTTRDVTTTSKTEKPSIKTVTVEKKQESKEMKSPLNRSNTVSTESSKYSASQKSTGKETAAAWKRSPWETVDSTSSIRVESVEKKVGEECAGLVYRPSCHSELICK